MTEGLTQAIGSQQKTDSIVAKPVSRLFSVAPMMDWTDRHCRYFHRLLSEHSLLYTEMVTTGALVFGDKERFLRHSPEEYPLALQLGGNDPEHLALSARYGEQAGYQEVNLNVGCPSDRVQNGRIGACLMAEPETVANAVKAMKDSVSIPVTVKHRIGIDGRESYEELVDFVGTVAEAGCETFIVHARIAILQGLSPKENRDVPPLKPEVVYQLKKDFPGLEVTINGGIKSFDDISQHLQHLDGVMLGREAYHNPYLLAEVDNRLYGSEKPLPERRAIIEQMLPYMEKELSSGAYLSHITRHLLGLYQGEPGARRFRRYISENAHKKGAGLEVLMKAVEEVEAVRLQVKENFIKD
ncbi:tRNA dihydrouridine(20/20a) synthase DusA [Endozoicomonas sp. OPT23]|uniref:tRNA dihydrouridine(20/20a) synthase DusA n=1 Tax=Endozoicomonas sp. OPT23 TaxID=2072845 RepID=UPI00129A0B3E|nr:tRNA dihydrouridine(20/20a) synthase DusA [Endozoicomonas sp. OPT23]MRI34683.1 tRNA dihydrouridine(20/20a) synthase DusA [Endozoicomonas sp. OPT23]